MSEPYGQPRYTGAALPAIDANVVLFNTVVAFPGKSFGAGAGIRRLIVDLKHDEDGTMNFYRSQDRGVTWDQVSTEAITAPAATSSTIRDFAVEPYMDYKLEFLNGGTAQTTFIVDMAFVDERGPLV